MESHRHVIWHQLRLQLQCLLTNPLERWPKKDRNNPKLMANLEILRDYEQTKYRKGEPNNDEENSRRMWRTTWRAKCFAKQTLEAGPMYQKDWTVVQWAFEFKDVNVIKILSRFYSGKITIINEGQLVQVGRHAVKLLIVHHSSLSDYLWPFT